MQYFRDIYGHSWYKTTVAYVKMLKVQNVHTAGVHSHDCEQDVTLLINSIRLTAISIYSSKKFREIRGNKLSPVGSRCVCRIRLHCSTVHQTKHSANNLSSFVIPAARAHRTPAACTILMGEEQLNAAGRSFRRGSYSTESPTVVQHHPQSLTVEFILSVLTVKISITHSVVRNASVVIWASYPFDAIICEHIILINEKKRFSIRSTLLQETRF